MGHDNNQNKRYKLNSSILSTHIYKSDKKDYHLFYVLPNMIFGNYYSIHHYHTNSKQI